MKNENKERLHVVQSYGFCEWCGCRAFFSLATWGENEIGYDARYCSVCNVWLEMGCSSDDCEFCGPRPERPSDVKFRVRIVGEPWPAVTFPLPRSRRMLELEEDEELE